MMLSIPERYARRVAARSLARELMACHGLHDWSFAFNRCKRSMGLCRWGRKTIELSIHLVDRNGLDEVRDTILHEIAHALAGPQHGHDAVWKAWCVKVGARPQRCGQANMPEGRWQARCPGCGGLFYWHRRPRVLTGWFCRPCGPQRGPLRWQKR
jgi:predicted SprT family Zn-dependent metalloprotease